MKKIFSIICIFALLYSAPCAFAELIFDLGPLSFQESLLLQETVAQELTTRSEWKEVTVPPGVYEIGVDIPAGYWDITLKNKSWAGAYVYYCNELDESKTIWSDADDSLIAFLYLDNDGPTQGIVLEEGRWLIVVSNPVVFTPHTRPSLGF